MSDLLPFLKSLLSISGLSAYEKPVARLIEQEWRPLVDELHFSRLGSVHACKRGRGKAPRPALLIAAHMDSIGLMVSGIVEGFLRFSPVGDVDVRVLPGSPVVVHAVDGEIPGVVVMPPRHLLPEDERMGYPSMEYLLVDTGLVPAQVSKRVQVGDLISVATQPVELAGGTLSGHAADNRASIAALTLTLNELQSKPHRWDVWAVATVQEETTFAGAASSSFQLKPGLAVILDVTFGKGPGAHNWEAFELGAGPTLGLGPSTHPFLFERFRELGLAAGLDLPVEPIPAASNTDADAIQLTAQGIPTMLLEIPLRYMHTPVELIALNDLQRTSRLLTDFITSLEEDFLESIEWL